MLLVVVLAERVVVGVEVDVDGDAPGRDDVVAGRVVVEREVLLTDRGGVDDVRATLVVLGGSVVVVDVVRTVAGVGVTDVGVAAGRTST